MLSLNLEKNALLKKGAGRRSAAQEKQDSRPLLILPEIPETGKEWRFEFNDAALSLLNFDRDAEKPYLFLLISPEQERLYVINDSSVDDSKFPFLKLRKNGSASSKPIAEALFAFIGEDGEKKFLPGTTWLLETVKDENLANVAVCSLLEENNEEEIASPVVEDESVPTEVVNDTEEEEDEEEEDFVDDAALVEGDNPFEDEA